MLRFTFHQLQREAETTLAHSDIKIQSVSRDFFFVFAEQQMSRRRKRTVMRAQEQRQGCSHCKILIGGGESGSAISGPNEGSLFFLVGMGVMNKTVSVWS